MTTLDTIRMGIIGCGGNGRGHLHYYLENYPGVVQIVGLADSSRAAREQAWEMTGRRPQVKLFASHEALLKRTRPDAVLISTPHIFHTQQILDSLAAGCHVLAEKPMVCSAKDARAVIAAAKRADRVLAISYNRHTLGPYIYTKRALESGEIGDIVFVSCWQSQNWWASQQGKWRQKLTLSCGGQLNDSGSHLLDIVLWMTGLQPQTAFAFQDNCGTEVDILTAASVRAQGGALMSFSVVAKSVNWVEDITIWGTQGTIAIRHPGEVWRWESDQQQWKVRKRELPQSRRPDDNFFAVLRGEETEIAAPPECGLAVMRLSEAVWKSAGTGKAEKVR
jgi:predicted dehydrogenase